MAFKGSVCCKLPRELLPAAVGAGQGTPGQHWDGELLGKGNWRQPWGEQGEELGGCRSPERSAEGAGLSTRVGEAWKYGGENAVLQYECTVDWETHKLLDAAVVIYIKVS